MSEQFRKGVEGLYAAFEGYPKPDNVAGSPVYGNLKEWTQELLKYSLRDIPGEELSRFAFKALTTWGDVGDFKHFLPRIFELLPFEQGCFDVSMVLGKLSYGNWEEWPETERRAIHSYLDGLWDLMLSDSKTFPSSEFSEYFVALASVHPDFNQLLQDWRGHGSKSGIQQLTAFVYTENTAVLDEKCLPGLQSKTDLGEAFFNWISSRECLEWLEQEFWKYSEEALGKQISDVLQLIDWAIQNDA